MLYFCIVCLLCSIVSAELNFKSPVFLNGRKNKSKKSSCSINKILSIRGGDTDQIDIRYFIAGGICAAFSHGITTPIDVVKTSIQSHPKEYSGISLIEATKKLIEKEGINFLLTGLSATIIGYGIEGALKFGLYEMFKGVFSTTTPSQFINFLLASVVAGGVASITLCPMEDARIRMVSDPIYAKDTLPRAFIRILSDQGLASTFSGLSAMLAKQIPYTMAKQVTFDLLAKFIYRIVDKFNINIENMRFMITLLAAFGASILACIFSQPGDVLLTASSSKDDLGLIGNSNRIYKNNGIEGFFAGVYARFIHVGGIITSQLMVYDLVKVALGLPVTGSH